VCDKQAFRDKGVVIKPAVLPENELDKPRTAEELRKIKNRLESGYFEFMEYMR
jgi:hypothetical protein